MKYTIKILYETGDSFNNRDETDVLELSWDNIDVAKENLQAIKDHYERAYKPLNSRRWNDKRTNEEILDEVKDEWWFVEKKLHHGGLDAYYAGNCMKLKTDDGNLMQLGCFWCGYFETLYGAEIITDESDMKFSI